MKIAIDARAWKWTGVGRYIRNLIREYARIEHNHEFTLLIPQGDTPPPEVAGAIARQPHMFSLQTVEPTYYSWKEQVIFPLQLQSVVADLFHFPHFNIPLVFHKPYVVTIHDTTRFIIPGQRRQGALNQIAYETIFSQAVRRARYVMSVSAHTSRELQNLHIMPATVPHQVIYEGVDSRFFESPKSVDVAKVRALIETDKPYLLHVGVWMSHKNLPRLLRAFARVLERYPNHRLVITGKPVPLYSDLLSSVRALDIEKNVIFPGFVPDNLLPALYSEANALVFPSLYEGFGLPALEAAASGTPVICSNVTSLPEIMEGAALYVNPEDSEDIARGVMHLLSTNQLRERLVDAGRARATQFSWQRCAVETLQVYENVG